MARFTLVSGGCAFTRLQPGVESTECSGKLLPVTVAIWNWQLQQRLGLSSFQPNGTGLRGMKRWMCFEQICLRTLRLLGPNFIQPLAALPAPAFELLCRQCPPRAPAAGPHKEPVAVTGSRGGCQLIVCGTSFYHNSPGHVIAGSAALTVMDFSSVPQK